MTGRVIQGERKLAENVESFEKKVATLGKEKKTYYTELVEKRMENNKLKKELEEKRILIESLKTELEEADGIIDSHEAALETAKVWRERREKDLKEKIDNQADMAYKYSKRLAEELVKAEKSEEKLMEERERRLKNGRELAKEQLQKEKLYELYLSNKPLPKTPSKFKILKEKTKTKFQHLIEKTKHQSQELIARIEVKVK